MQTLTFLAALLFPQDNTLTEKEKKDGWKLLFDGKTTEGWRGYKKEKAPDGWKVEDGALARTGGGGDIMTAEEFDSFELALDYKIAKKGNSGILYWVVEGDGDSYVSAPEFQVLDNEGTKTDWSSPHAAGACYALYPATKNAAKPGGEWNKVRLIIDGKKVEHWLNGEKIVEYEIDSADWKKRVAASKFKAWPQFAAKPKGHLCLQDHGDRVEYKNIKIRVIGKKK